MLRVSARKSETEVDIQGIGGDAEGAGRGIEHGRELMQFAEALASRDEGALASAREALHSAAGSRVLVDAAGVAANFQRMVRIADPIGIPYDSREAPMSKEIQAELNLHRFPSAQHALGE